MSKAINLIGKTLDQKTVSVRMSQDRQGHWIAIGDVTDQNDVKVSRFRYTNDDKGRLITIIELMHRTELEELGQDDKGSEVNALKVW